MAKADLHCPFCDLIHGAGEVSICYEDSDALAFMDIQPVNAGHVLVVPRQHHESLVDTPPELAMHLFEVSMKLASVIRKVTKCEDMNIVVNSGKTAGQDVFHYHVHLIPCEAIGTARELSRTRGTTSPTAPSASQRSATPSTVAVASLTMREGTSIVL